MKVHRNTTPEDAIQRVRNCRSVWCIVRENHVQFVKKYSELLKKAHATTAPTAGATPVIERASVCILYNCNMIQ